MLRPKAYASLVIALLVIPAEGINPALAFLSVEPYVREQTPSRLDTLGSSALALVGDGLDLEASRGNMILKPDRRYCVHVRPVMRQDTKRIPVLVFP